MCCVKYDDYFTQIKKRGSVLILNYSNFFDYCRLLENVSIFTIARNKEFSVKIENSSLYFVPKSSKKSRKVDEKKTQEVIEYFIKYNDWSQASYKSITFHASYILAVMHHEKNNLR